MPDIFVPLDTTKFTDYHRKIVNRGIVNKVSVQYIDQHRAELKKKYPTFEKFNKDYEVGNDVLNELKKQAENEKIEIDPAQVELSKPLIKLQIKALIARDLWEMNEYNKIMDVENESLQKAIQILTTPGKYRNNFV